MRTAARLLDVRSAVRTVIADSVECSSSGIHAPCSVWTGSSSPVMSERRRVAGFERSRIDERLERRARLAKRLRRAIETARLEIAAADHRAHFSCRRIHGDERGFQAIAWRALGPGAGFRVRRFRAARASICFERFRNHGLGGALHVRIDGGVDLQAAFREPLPAELLHQLLANLFLEVLAERLFTAKIIAQCHRLLRRALEGLFRDDVLIVQRVQHKPATRDSARHAHRRRIQTRRVDQSGEERRFGKVELGRPTSRSTRAPRPLHRRGRRRSTPC